jgi:hypothetical protein
MGENKKETMMKVKTHVKAGGIIVGFKDGLMP